MLGGHGGGGSGEKWGDSRHTLKVQLTGFPDRCKGEREEMRMTSGSSAWAPGRVALPSAGERRPCFVLPLAGFVGRSGRPTAQFWTSKFHEFELQIIFKTAARVMFL